MNSTNMWDGPSSSALVFRALRRYPSRIAFVWDGGSLSYAAALEHIGRLQAAFASWLDLPEKKMSVSQDVWASMGASFYKNRRIVTARCESDVTTLEQLYLRAKHLVRDIKR